MQRLLHIIMYLLVTMILLNSCSKEWFDKKASQSLAVPSSMEDFEALLNNFEVMNANTPGLGEVASDGHYMPDERFFALTINDFNNVQRNAYTFSNSFPYLAVGDWNMSYQRISYCNLVIEGLKKYQLKNGDDKVKLDEINGNAYFHRAKSFLDIAQIFSEPFRKSSSDKDLGIPLKMTIDVNEPAERASVKDTYNQIINDFKAAASLLPQFGTYLTWGNKSSAFAFLARTFLIMGDFENAKLYADSSLNIYNTLMDFNTISQDATNLGMLNKETLYYSRMFTWTFTFSTGYIFIDSAFYDSYAINDLRKTRYFRSRPGGIAFKGTYNNNVILFTGIATDEVYLIRAECLARMGDTEDALYDLNHLLRSRWNNQVQYSEIESENNEEVLKIIIQERNKELFMRGVRWSDLKRLNQDDRFKIEIKRKIGDVVYELAPNSYKYTFPIPQDVMKLAPKIKQSPGWN